MKLIFTRRILFNQQLSLDLLLILDRCQGRLFGIDLRQRDFVNVVQLRVHSGLSFLGYVHTRAPSPMYLVVDCESTVTSQVSLLSP